MSSNDQLIGAVRRSYITALRDHLGLECVPEDLGWLGICAHRHWFLVMLDVEDTGSVRVATSVPWPPGTTRAVAAAAAHRANRLRRGVKTTLATETDAAVFAAEMIVGPHGAVPVPEHLAVVLDRSLASLAAALQDFASDLLLAELAASLGWDEPAVEASAPAMPNGED